MNPRQTSSSECEICGVTRSRSLIIHNVRHRANTHHYCTNCVLKQHPGTFCPICFELFDDSLSPHLRLVCVRCPSIAHRSCALNSTIHSAAPSPGFRCPTCIDPNFTFFKPPDRKTGPDAQSAKVLVTAARIAAMSMSKAAAAARFRAEQQAREATVAKKRAREALEHLAAILAKEKALAEKKGVSAKNARRRAAK